MYSNVTQREVILHNIVFIFIAYRYNKYKNNNNNNRHF
jgi:hypothetical protein